METSTSTAEDPIAQIAEEKRTWPGWSTIESEPVRIESFAHLPYILTTFS